MGLSARVKGRARTIGRGAASKFLKRVGKRPGTAPVSNPTAKSMLEMHEDWVKANIEGSIMNKGMVGSAVGGTVGGVAGSAFGPIGEMAGSVAGSAIGSVLGDAISPGGKKADLRAKTLIKEDECDADAMKCDDSMLKRGTEEIMRANIKNSISGIYKTFVSEAQRDYFHFAAKHHQGGITEKMVDEFESKTPKGKKLPKHVKKSWHGVVPMFTQIATGASQLHHELNAQMPHMGDLGAVGMSGAAAALIAHHASNFVEKLKHRKDPGRAQREHRAQLDQHRGSLGLPPATDEEHSKVWNRIIEKHPQPSVKKADPAILGMVPAMTGLTALGLGKIAEKVVNHVAQKKIDKKYKKMEQEHEAYHQARMTEIASGRRKA